jgi:two-component system OmpR family response regulator
VTLPAGKAVLVVEDDRETRAFLVAVLEEVGDGVDVVAVASLAAGRAAVHGRSFDLLVVDRMLPDGQGLDWVRELRAAESSVPVLLLTALREVAQRVEGLEAGADDYLGKPFAPLELKARVRALLRRGQRTRRQVEDGPLRLDMDRREAFVGGTEVPLTEREFRVLERLVTSQGIRREELLEEVWGEATPETTASLDVVVSRLRRKLAQRSLADAIETVRGYGLRWRGDR